MQIIKFANITFCIIHTAIQAQASWAYGSNSNLLGSGYHQPLGGQLGSGIYEGVRGAVTYTFDSDSGSTMLVGNLPTRPQPRHKIADVNTKFDSDVELKSNVAAYHSFLREDLQNYTTAVLNFALDQELLCTENEFCCQVNYKMRNVSGPISLENYRLVVFNGTRTVAAKTAEYDWQVCAVVRCLNYTLESCSENDKASSEIHLPNFETFQLKAFFDVKPETTEFLPTFNALDAQFALISPSLFSIETNVGENSAMQISSNSLGQVNIKTVALIKKVFETEWIKICAARGVTLHQHHAIQADKCFFIVLHRLQMCWYLTLLYSIYEKYSYQLSCVRFT